jgi:hypothetical protein
MKKNNKKTKKLIFSHKIYSKFNISHNFEHPHLCSGCEPAKIFLTSKFSYLLFCNLAHKTETRAENRVGTRY